MRPQPLIVVEDDQALFDEIASEFAHQSYPLCRGWDVPSNPASAVCVGEVGSRGEAEAALVVAVAGAGVVAHVLHTHGDLAMFVDDLGRIGPVDMPTRDDRVVHLSIQLDDEQSRLLQLLADGRTIVDAARALHLSLRTTNRRLASVRLALGARSTAEAVHTARRLGLC